MTRTSEVRSKDRPESSPSIVDGSSLSPPAPVVSPFYGAVAACPLSAVAVVVLPQNLVRREIPATIVATAPTAGRTRTGLAGRGRQIHGRWPVRRARTEVANEASVPDAYLRAFQAARRV